jgi:rubredoxin
VDTLEVQNKLADAIFEGRAGGKPVTIVQGKGFQEIEDIRYCPSCEQIHFVIKWTE